jgi:agmatine/peptidylarginine deiminase
MIYFPAEWYPQSGVQLTWPHENTDWRDMLPEVTECYIRIAKAIINYEKLLIVCQDEETVKGYFTKAETKNIIFREIACNDTWARDHGAISVFADGCPTIYDFTFNGLGKKFEAEADNRITRALYNSSAFSNKVKYADYLHFVLEGGSIETDGKGTLLTTAECLLSEHRNNMSKEEIEFFLMQVFEAKRILWLNHGYLEGDDTDSHIDTLARFCNETTIAYVKCTDNTDVHYESLHLLEKELKSFKTLSGEPYTLIELPMADAVYEDNQRLPATYANFLIINNAVLVPTYNSPKDKLALQQIQHAFPDREIIGINCLPLIRQHGSLHCISMQYPEGFL